MNSQHGLFSNINGKHFVGGAGFSTQKINREILSLNLFYFLFFYI